MTVSLARVRSPTMVLSEPSTQNSAISKLGDDWISPNATHAAIDSSVIPAATNHANPLGIASIVFALVSIAIAFLVISFSLGALDEMVARPSPPTSAAYANGFRAFCQAIVGVLLAMAGLIVSLTRSGVGLVLGITGLFWRPRASAIMGIVCSLIAPLALRALILA